MFTALGVALSKYHPERVMEHIRIFWGRMNLPRMIKATEEAHLWPELVFLYTHYDEFDNASLAMMERASDAWGELFLYYINACPSPPRIIY